MSKEVYILKSQVHFGSLKTSVPKGTKIVLDRSNRTVEINGAMHDNVSDIELGIRAGYVIPFVDGETKVDTTVKISPKAQERQKKLEVHQSDLDVMPKEIDISDTKNEVREAKRKSASRMTVSYEKDEPETRGMKVVKNEATGLEANTQEEILSVVNGDSDYKTIKSIAKEADSKKPAFGLSNTADANDAASVINGQEGTVVAKIGKSESTKPVGTGKALVAKHASKGAADRAKANAEARKRASEARRAKQEKQAKEDIQVKEDNQTREESQVKDDIQVKDDSQVKEDIQVKEEK